jgi:LysM repeat protein
LVDRISQHHVAPGDSLTSIAARFGIGVDTLRWANALPADPNLLFAGQKLTVLPVDGVLYAVLPGDTLQSVATAARVSVGDLAEANGLPQDATLEIGQHLLVPGGRPRATTLPPPSREGRIVGAGTASQQQFIQMVVPLARDAQRETGVPASVTIAQAILESDWGTSLLTRAAINYFGIKAIGNPNAGDVYWSNTWEVVDGEDVVVRAAFQTYQTAQDSFLDHGQFFLRNRRYAAALLVTGEPRKFAQAIADAGYATDPAYAGKLIRLMDQYQLYQYDSSAGSYLNAPLSTPRSSADSQAVADGGAISTSDGAIDCHCWMVPVRPPTSIAAP